MAGDWNKALFEKLLSEPVRNGIYKTKDFHGRGAKIVNMGELFAHPRLRAVPMKRVALNESECRRFLLSKGDLIFARRSLTAEGAGKCSVVLELDEATTFESSIIRARPDTEKADPLYLYYFFNSPSGFHSLDTIRRQVAVAGITGGDLAKLEIPTPAPPRTTRYRPHPEHARRQDRTQPPPQPDPGGYRPHAVPRLVRRLRSRPRQARRPRPISPLRPLEPLPRPPRR